MAHITSNATEKTLIEGKFSANRVKEIVENVLSGAVEAAEESGKDVKYVARGAFEGAPKGIAAAVESVGENANEFTPDDLTRAKEDFDAIEELL